MAKILSDKNETKDTFGQKAEISTQEGNWTGQELQTESTPLVDPGSGRKLILRMFEFTINPQKVKEIKAKKIKLDKQQLFNMHWPQIKTMIWGDGLVANRDVDPRVIIGRKNYRIFVLCEPKFGTMVADKTKTLQELLNPLTNKKR